MKNKKTIIISVVIFLSIIGFYSFISQQENKSLNFLENDKRIAEQINYIEQKISPYAVHKEFFESHFYPSYDSAILAWKESYILNAYLDLYQTTNEKRYLEKFEDRANRILEAVKAYTEGKLLSSRYSENLTNNGSFENIENFDKNFKAIQQNNPPIFTDCNNNILINFGLKALEFFNEGKLSIPFSSSESYSLYLLRFWFKAPSDSKIKVSLDGVPLSEFQTTSNEWEVFVSDFQINQSFQGQHTVTIEGPRRTLIDLVDIQGYLEHPVHYGMMLEVLLRGITLGAGIDKNIVQNWLDEMNGVYYDPALNFFIFFSEEKADGIKKGTFLNAAATLGTANIYASQIFNNPNYRKIAIDVATGFKNTITIEDDDIIWPYTGYLKNGSVMPTGKDNFEDISHGNLDIDFIMRAYENNTIFTKEDMMNLADVFIKNLWNGDIESPLFRKFVNGRGEIYNRILTIWSWIELSRFNSEIKDIAIKYYLN